MTLVSIAQSLERPALAVQTQHLTELLRGQALPPQLDARSAQVSRHGRPVDLPADSQLLHVGAGLVLGYELSGLIGRQASLDGSRRGRSRRLGCLREVQASPRQVPELRQEFRASSC